MNSHVYVKPRNPAWKGRCGYRIGEGWCRKDRSDPIHVGSMPPGAKRVITCPFGPHGGTVYTRGVAPDELIEQHTIGFTSTPEYIGLACPASLMRWPLDDAAQSALVQQARDLARQFQRDANNGGAHDDPPPVPQDYAATPKGLLHVYCATRHYPGDHCPGPKSQNLRQPGRLGREPDPESPDWALGGRIDEDVIPHDQVVKGKIPATTQGVAVGRGTGMASLSDAVAMAGAARQNTDDVASKLNEAVASLNEAIGVVSELMGDSQSETLTAWMHALTTLREDLQWAAQARCGAANELGQTFINNLIG